MPPWRRQQLKDKNTGSAEKGKGKEEEEQEEEEEGIYMGNYRLFV